MDFFAAKYYMSCLMLPATVVVHILCYPKMGTPKRNALDIYRAMLIALKNYIPFLKLFRCDNSNG